MKTMQGIQSLTSNALFSSPLGKLGTIGLLGFTLNHGTALAGGETGPTTPQNVLEQPGSTQILKLDQGTSTQYQAPSSPDLIATSQAASSSLSLWQGLTNETWEDILLPKQLDYQAEIEPLMQNLPAQSERIATPEKDTEAAPAENQSSGSSKLLWGGGIALALAVGGGLALRSRRRSEEEKNQDDSIPHDEAKPMSEKPEDSEDPSGIYDGNPLEPINLVVTGDEKVTIDHMTDPLASAHSFYVSLDGYAMPEKSQTPDIAPPQLIDDDRQTDTPDEDIPDVEITIAVSKSGSQDGSAQASSGTDSDDIDIELPDGDIVIKNEAAYQGVETSPTEPIVNEDWEELKENTPTSAARLNREQKPLTELEKLREGFTSILSDYRWTERGDPEFQNEGTFDYLDLFYNLWVDLRALSQEKRDDAILDHAKLQRRLAEVLYKVTRKGLHELQRTKIQAGYPQKANLEALEKLEKNTQQLERIFQKNEILAFNGNFDIEVDKLKLSKLIEYSRSFTYQYDLIKLKNPEAEQNFKELLKAFHEAHHTFTQNGVLSKEEKEQIYDDIANRYTQWAWNALKMGQQEVGEVGELYEKALNLLSQT